MLAECVGFLRSAARCIRRFRERVGAAGPVFMAALLLQGTEFNFRTIGIVLAGVSLGGIGVILTGAFLFADQVEQYKKHIPTVIAGLILIGVSSALIAAFGGG
jgi:hypothetical protein